MAITVNDIQTELNTIISDATTARVTAAQRLSAITEGVVWVKENAGNDYELKSYDLNYFDGIYRYEITTDVADLMEVADLRRGQNEQRESFGYKSPRELAEEIGMRDTESAFSIERVNGRSYLVVNHSSRYAAYLFDAADQLDTNGTWAADTSTSDATNVTRDIFEYTQGAASINFDVDVSQSGNDRATISKTMDSAIDLSAYENLASWVIDAFIPDVTDVNSYTFYWGSSDSNYWSLTATTDYNGNALRNGWNTIKFDWDSASATGTPDEAAIAYLRIDVNYDNTQVDDTDFRIDNIRIIRPEVLSFTYNSWAVGTNSSGTTVYKFGATTDVPYFSGQYDNLKFAVAHRAAAILYSGPLRLYDEAEAQDTEAGRQLSRIIKAVPSSKQPQVRTFKPRGISMVRISRRFRR